MDIKKGQSVVLKGLTKAASFNGLQGEVVGPMTNGRFPVKITVDGKIKHVRVKPDNLECVTGGVDEKDEYIISPPGGIAIETSNQKSSKATTFKSKVANELSAQSSLKEHKGVRQLISDYCSNVIEVTSMDELRDALKTVSSKTSGRFIISLAKGTYTSETELKIPADRIQKFEGVNMNRKSSTVPSETSDSSILDMPVKIVASSRVSERKESSFDFELIGVSVLKQLTVDTKNCVPRMKIERVHSTTNSGDAMVIKSAKEVLMNDCEVFGGEDGLMIDDATVHIKSSDIRFAESRGIFANDHFTVEDVEVSNCGGYGMKTRGGVTRLGDNDIQPGPWDGLGFF